MDAHFIEFESWLLPMLTLLVGMAYTFCFISGMLNSLLVRKRNVFLRFGMVTIIVLLVIYLLLLYNMWEVQLNALLTVTDFHKTDILLVRKVRIDFQMFLKSKLVF